MKWVYIDGWLKSSYGTMFSPEGALCVSALIADNAEKCESNCRVQQMEDCSTHWLLQSVLQGVRLRLRVLFVIRVQFFKPHTHWIQHWVQLSFIFRDRKSWLFIKRFVIHAPLPPECFFSSILLFRWKQIIHEITTASLNHWKHCQRILCEGALGLLL